MVETLDGKQDTENSEMTEVTFLNIPKNETTLRRCLGRNIGWHLYSWITPNLILIAGAKGNEVFSLFYRHLFLVKSSLQLLWVQHFELLQVHDSIGTFFAAFISCKKFCNNPPFLDIIIRQSYLSFVVRDIYSDLLTEKTFRCIITIIVCFHSDKNELSMGKIYARWVTLPNGLGKLVG